MKNNPNPENEITISYEKFEIYEAFISYMLKNGIKVIMYLCPLRSDAYQRVSKYEYYKVIGGYSGNLYGLKDTDFLDDTHTRESVNKKLFRNLSAQDI